MDVASVVTANRSEPSWGRSDWRNLLLIVVGYAIALWPMPINHDFPITDDWSYAQAVAKLVGGQGFSPPQWAQMTLVSHSYWGALFVWLFGFSFTSLTLATMVMSLTGVIAFYLLLRQLGFSATLSGLGVATLAFNPDYLSLSYTYMTDVTFLTLLLLGSLFYLKGLAGNGKDWLWLGGGFASLAFLTRQFGLALPLAALLWLLLARRLNWQRGLATMLLPAATALIYLFWRSTYPSTMGDLIGAQTLTNLLRNPVDMLVQQSMLMLYWLPFLGLTLPLFWFNPLVHKPLLIPWLAAIGLAVYLLQQSLDAGYQANLVGSEPWRGQPFKLEDTPFWWIGIALTAWLFAILSERGWRWANSHLRQRLTAPVDFLYILVLILWAGTFLVNRFGFDSRYQLTLIPFCIIAALMPMRRLAGRKLVAMVAALMLLATYSIVQHLDEYDYYRVQWQAGRELLAAGVPADTIDNGFAWDGYYYFDEVRTRLNTLDYDVFQAQRFSVIDRRYIIAVRQKTGYKVVRQIPYFSRIMGWSNHYLLVMQREQ